VKAENQETKAKNLSPYNNESLPYLSGYIKENLAVFF
jgi:hypothetical protein